MRLRTSRSRIYPLHNFLPSLFGCMKLPKSWNDITIKNFVESYDILLDNTYDIIEKNLYLLSVLSGEPVSYFESLPISKLKEAVARVQFLNDLKSINTKLPVTFNLGNRIFDVTHDPRKLIGGQYIDLMNILSQCHSQKDINDQMHNLLAVICVPRRGLVFKGRYNGSRHKEVADLFYARLTMNIAYPVALFFCNLWEYLMPAIKTCLEEERNGMLMMAMKKCQTLLSEDGAGILRSMHSQMEAEINGNIFSR